MQEALALLDELGFEGLTMRRLAERLGVQAASLYNHVRDKYELLALMADALCGEVDLPPADRSWRDTLEAIARDYRRVQLNHRDGARVLVSTPPVGPTRLSIIARVVAALHAAGFSGAESADVANVFNTYLTGFVLDETQALPAGDRPNVPVEEMQPQVLAWFKALPVDEYPTLVALADDLVEPHMDRRFELGLRALLTGFDSLLASHSTARN